MRSGVSRAVLVSGAFLLLGQTRFGEAQDWRGTGRIEGSVTDEAGHRPGRDAQGRVRRARRRHHAHDGQEGPLGPGRGRRLQLGLRHRGRGLRAEADRDPAAGRVRPASAREGAAQESEPPPRRPSCGPRRRRPMPRTRRDASRRRAPSTRSCWPCGRPRAHDPPADRVHVRAGEAVRQGREELEKVLAPSPERGSARSPCRRRSRAAWWTRRARPLRARRVAHQERRRLLQHGRELLQRRRGKGRDRLLRQGARAIPHTSTPTTGARSPRSGSDRRRRRRPTSRR